MLFTHWLAFPKVAVICSLAAKEIVFDVVVVPPLVSTVPPIYVVCHVCTQTHIKKQAQDPSVYTI
jgi:hypothetical protein